MKVGFDATKALRWMFTLIALPIGILTILALPMHAILGQTKIQECGYAFAPCKDYHPTYSDDRQMTIVDGFRNRDGRLTPRAGIVIDFSDGRRWSSTNFGDSKPRLAPALEEFLENHVHLAYNYVPAKGDIPRFPVPGPIKIVSDWTNGILLCAQVLINAASSGGRPLPLASRAVKL